MRFIVILIALLIERFFDWSHLRGWHWYANYQRAMTQRFSDKPPYVALALTIIPLLMAVALLQYMLKNSLFGVVEFLFQLFLFLYCLGPQNLWADTFACMNALSQGDAPSAAEKLKTTFGVDNTEPEKSLSQQLINNIFIAANGRIFAIVFWFMVLGPVGAVLYRVMALASSSATTPNAAAVKHETSPDVLQSARSVEAVLDWVPVRIFSCIFALGGHFAQVFACWRKQPMFSLNNNEALLTACGAAALGNEEANVLEDNASTMNAIGLLDRALVIVLAIVAVIVLLG
jgi:AmpE protein